MEDFDPSAYRTATLWVPVPVPPSPGSETVHVPVTLAGRVDTWPLDTGRPLPLVLQVGAQRIRGCRRMSGLRLLRAY